MIQPTVLGSAVSLPCKVMRASNTSPEGDCLFCMRHHVLFPLPRHSNSPLSLTYGCKSVSAIPSVMHRKDTCISSTLRQDTTQFMTALEQAYRIHAGNCRVETLEEVIGT